MQASNNQINNEKSHEARPSLGKARKAKKPQCPSGREEHTWEPEWKGRGFTHYKCRFCGKRTPA